MFTDDSNLKYRTQYFACAYIGDEQPDLADTNTNTVHATLTLGPFKGLDVDIDMNSRVDPPAGSLLESSIYHLARCELEDEEPRTLAVCALSYNEVAGTERHRNPNPRRIFVQNKHISKRPVTPRPFVD